MIISPLAPTSYPTLPPIDGVRLATAEAGIRYKNRTDLLLVELSEGTQAAGVFTRSLTASAPVEACRNSVKNGTARVLVVNSGNSNAFTGKAGVQSVERVAKDCSKLFRCKPSDVYMASTGVIGEKLPDEKITDALPGLLPALSPANWEQAARAIMTTDTYPKMATRQLRFAGKTITINGIAKGSGMIAPDMATMLAFVFTDAPIPAWMLNAMLSVTNGHSFNSITVDGDTSTSDTVLLFATGKIGQPENRYLEEDDHHREWGDFYYALLSLLTELAQLIVRDGEGASKFVTVKVNGAEHDAGAKRIAFSIANSPLVKTAIAAGDANWGRIVMAVGKAGEKADRDGLSIKIGDVLVAKNGTVDPTYREETIVAHMKGRDIVIEVDVGVGSGKATVWTCDLTHRYIDINGSYRS